MCANHRRMEAAEAAATAGRAAAQAVSRRMTHQGCLGLKKSRPRLADRPSLTPAMMRAWTLPVMRFGERPVDFA